MRKLEEAINPTNSAPGMQIKSHKDRDWAKVMEEVIARLGYTLGSVCLRGNVLMQNMVPTPYITSTLF